MGKPLIGVDMDGVLCRPPLGLNVAINKGPFCRSVRNPHAFYQANRFHPVTKLFFSIILRCKYIGRIHMADAKSGLEHIGEHRSLILVTSRTVFGHGLIRSWLVKYGLLDIFDRIYSNNTGLPSPDFKCYMAKKLGFDEFIDDDGQVADALSKQGLGKVYLRDWPKNRGYNYMHNVIRIHNLEEVARYVSVDDSA